MSVPGASHCSREWFPPATFQMRLRGLKGISYKVDPVICSKDGWIAVSLQMSCGHDPFWKSIPIKWQGEETLAWTDLSFPASVPSGLRGVVLRLFYNPPGKTVDEFQFTAEANFFAIGIHFSGLSCVGAHNPRLGHVPKGLVHSNLLFFISGSYFILPPSKDEDLRSADLVRHCSFGPFEANQTVSSYDPSLLSRFLRIQRAIRQQNIANQTLKTSLLKIGADPCRADLAVSSNPAQVSLRQQVFSDLRKDPLTRIKETRIKRELEALRLRVEFIREEKKKRELELEESVKEVAAIRSFIEEKTSSLMHSFHSFAKEKASFESWNEDFVASCDGQFEAGKQLQCAQIQMLSNFKEFYPIQISQNSPPTIRWVTMPSVDESRSNSRQEIMMSVTAGWVAELTKIFSSILDLPLRYPIRNYGSFSCIQDNIRFATEKEFEFPLYTGKFDVAKVEYAIYLLNKNLGQIRWGCGFTTVDLRKTLYNLHEIMSITFPPSDRTPGGRALIQIRSLSPPPNSQILANVAPACATSSRARNHSQQRRRGSLSPAKHSNFHTSKTSGASSDGNEKRKADVEERKSFEKQKVVSQRKPVISSTKPLITTTNRSTTLPSMKEPSVRRVQEDCRSSSTPPSASNMFWGDVTNRTKALSIPTSFQKRQKPKPIDS